MADEVKSKLSEILPQYHDESGNFKLPTTPEGSAEPKGSVTVTGFAPNSYPESEPLKNIEAAGSGALAGYAAEKMFPMEGAAEATPKEIKRAEDKAALEKFAAENEGVFHEKKLDVLQGAHQNAKAELEDVAKMLQEAQEEAAKHGIYTPSAQKTEFGKLIVDETDLPAALGKNVIKPLGGEGTLHYGEAFGMTPYDAAQAVDMTKGQHGKGAWDIAEKAREAEAKIGPGYAMVPERSNLMLPTDLPKAKGEKVDLKAAEEARKKLKEATLAHREAQKAVAQAQLDIEKHMANPPSSMERAEKSALKAEKAAELLKTGESTLSKVARATAARIPGALTGAGAGYDTYQLLRDIEAGNVGPGILHGMSAAGGALSMVPTPMTKGVGAAMMAPAIGYDIYQALKE